MTETNTSGPMNTEISVEVDLSTKEQQDSVRKLDELITPKPPREWNIHQMFVPDEEPIKDGSIHGKLILRTSDQTTYIRNPENNVIRKVSNEVKGKAAKKAAKRLKHASIPRLQSKLSSNDNATETNSEAKNETKKETTEELISRLKGMMK